MSARHDQWLPPLALAVLVALLFLGAPHGGDFFWSDAPRHALNGVFVKDLLLDLPWRDPAGYAYRYYAQYPALTILFYPPLFYFVSAPFYAVFGVSQETALLVVALHYVALAWGVWRLFRHWLPAWPAAAGAAMLVAAPEIAFWGRQVMLEIPAFAFLVWANVCFVDHLRSGKPRALYWAVALLVLAMYTKISVGFVALAWAGTLLVERRAALLRDRHMWIAAVLAIVALVPLIVLTLKFGQANVQSVSGVPDSRVSRATIAGWIWYLKEFPGQLGWPLCIAAAVGVGAGFFRRHGAAASITRSEMAFWVLWFLIGYLFYSLIDLKEARHSVFILPPLVFAATALAARLAQGPVPMIGRALLAVLPAAVIAQTAFARPVFYVHGYAEVADYVARHAPRDSRVLFSGYRDGAFTFNMRSREDRRDLGVVRADKILLRVAVRREIGVAQKALGEADIAAQINALGIHYVVAQPGFWTDLEVMQRFERVLASDQFEPVATIETPANYPAQEQRLVIYRNKGDVAAAGAAQSIELPIIGRTIDTAK